MLLASIIIIVDILTSLYAGMYYDNNIMSNEYTWHPAGFTLVFFVVFVITQYILLHYLPKTTVFGTFVIFAWMVYLAPGHIICRLC